MHFDNMKAIENIIDSYTKSYVEENLKEAINDLIINKKGNIDEAQKDFMKFINEMKSIGAEIFENKRRENYEKAEAAKELERHRQLKAERQRKEEEAARLAEEANRRREAAETLRRKQREAKINDILEAVQEKLKDKTTTETPKKSINTFEDEFFNKFLSDWLDELFK